MTKRYSKKVIDQLNEVQDTLDTMVENKSEGEIDLKSLSKGDFPKPLKIRIQRAINAYENAMYELEDIAETIEEILDAEERDI